MLLLLRLNFTRTSTTEGDWGCISEVTFLSLCILHIDVITPSFSLPRYWDEQKIQLIINIIQLPLSTMQTICIYSDHVAQQLENQICFNPKQTVQSLPSVQSSTGPKVGGSRR